MAAAEVAENEQLQRKLEMGCDYCIYTKVHEHMNCPKFPNNRSRTDFPFLIEEIDECPIDSVLSTLDASLVLQRARDGGHLPRAGGWGEQTAFFDNAATFYGAVRSTAFKEAQRRRKGK